MILKKQLNKLLAAISRNKTRTCKWCKKPSKFKLKHIYSIADPIGHIRPVCDECVKTCCKGD